ncbi:MAG: hypothetical protein ABI761_19460 [Saprospiraceae bacterium]
MKEELDHIQDIAEIRSMMERSSKFLSLSGWAGVLAGIYALAGAWLAYKVFHFNPDEIDYPFTKSDSLTSGLWNVILLAFMVLVMSLCTAIFLSNKKAVKSGEKLWNSTTRRVLMNMAIPLITGGLLILILISKGLNGLIAPCTLLFYGLAIFNLSKFTYEEVKTLGFIEIALGLFSAYFIEYGLLCWALGFGIIHILYGIYIHYKYER